jgi:PEP-CTERM motif
MTIRAMYLATTAILALGAFAAPSAQAGYVVTLEEVGSNVVATGSGPIDLTGLTLASSDETTFSQMFPGLSVIITGTTSVAPVDVYGGTSGPLSFGSGSLSNASSGSGDIVGISNDATALAVPLGYVSGSPLSDTSTYDSATFATLGVTPGVYEWTWGAGANQNFTLDIESGGGAVPEPSTWAMMLIGFAGLGYASHRASRKSAALAA